MGIKPPSGLIQRSESLTTRLRRKGVALSEFLTQSNAFHVYFCLLIMGLYFISPSSFFERIENVAHDFFFRQRTLPVHSDIAVVEIAEDSIQALGRWPWPRSFHAVLVHVLHEWGARAIVFDILFSEPSTPLDDQALQESLQQALNVYFPVILEPAGDRNIWIKSMAAFNQYAKNGHINIRPDKDGTLRRIKPYITEAQESYPHLAVKVASDYLGKEFTHGPDDLLIPWAGRWAKTFRHFSYADILQSYQAVQSGKTPRIQPGQIRGKICLIGLTATGHADIKANPLEEAFPALSVHANVINGILTHRFLKTASKKMNTLALAVIGFLAVLILVPFRNIISLAGVSLLSLLWLGGSFLFFLKVGLLLETIKPLFLIFTLFIFSAIFALVISNKERFKFFELATRDGLTGLYVIRHFRVLLNQAIRDAHQKSLPLSVILTDIDNFKKINDTYGHQAGDMILKGVAQSIQSNTRFTRAAKECDLVARYGGEEIIVMTYKSNLLDAAFKVAERIRKSVEETKFQWDDKLIPVTISLGVSTLHPGENNMEDLIRRSDEALYRAKHEGKNRVCVEGAGLKESSEKVA